MQDESSEPLAGDRKGGKAESRLPWLEAIDESQLETEDDSMRKTWLIAGGAIAMMILFSSLIWFLYGRAAGDDPNAPFLVRAPEEPTKVEPAERGGMEVLHQDRLVFGRVSGQEKPTKESMTESPEEPLERPQAQPPPAKEIPSPVEPVVTPPSVEEIPRQQPRASETAVALAGNYRLQLGAFGQDDGARTNWESMKGRHSSVLASLDFDIEPVTIGARTLYRLRAGPFASRAEAEAACRQLRAAAQDCLVVVP